MALADIPIPTKSHTCRGVTFDVRGLSFADLTRLLIDHKDDAVLAFELFEQAGGDAADATALMRLAGTFVQAMPDLVAKTIALAADEPDAAPIARRLPAPVQLDALLDIGKLTFEEPEHLKKFLANLTELFQGMSQLTPTQP